MLSLVGLQITDGRIHMRSVFILLGLKAVSEQTKISSLVFQDEELLRFRRIICEEDLFSVDVSEDNDDKRVNEFYLIFLGQFLFLPDLFDFIDV